MTNIRRNVYENSNLAGFHGRGRIASRREKALKTSPRPFICFEHGDIILVRVYACLNERRKNGLEPGIRKFY